MLPTVITTAVIWFALGLFVARAMGGITDDAALDAPIWHPHTERPEDLATAIIAIPDEDDDGITRRLLPGIFFMTRDGQWREERSDETVRHPVFWWAAESDLVATLPHPHNAIGTGALQ